MRGQRNTAPPRPHLIKHGTRVLLLFCFKIRIVAGIMLKNPHSSQVQLQPEGLQVKVYAVHRGDYLSRNIIFTAPIRKIPRSIDYKIRFAPPGSVVCLSRRNTRERLKKCVLLGQGNLQLVWFDSADLMQLRSRFRGCRALRAFRADSEKCWFVSRSPQEAPKASVVPD